MRTRYTLLSAVSLATTLCAQPTLNLSNITPLSGSTVEFIHGDALPPGSAGPNQTWNFAAATNNSSSTLTFVAPSSTPNFQAFPSATAAWDSGTGVFGYAQYTSTGVYDIGQQLIGFLLATYSDPVQVLKLPLTMSGSWTDAFAGSVDIAGTVTTITGNITGLADGYGSVVLPWGTVTNALRVRTINTQTQITSGVTMTITTTLHQYFRPGLASPVAEVFERTTNGPGGTTTDEGFGYVTESSNGIGDSPEEGETFIVGPNPAHGTINVFYGPSGQVSVELIDALGRSWLSQVTKVAGDRFVLDVSACAPGLYTLRLADPGGRVSDRLVVLE